jgi:hypothetical protein
MPTLAHLERLEGTPIFGMLMLAITEASVLRTVMQLQLAPLKNVLVIQQIHTLCYTKIMPVAVPISFGGIERTQTTGEAVAGSSKYYVDWVRGKCVQDCDGDAPCGGLAPSWITVKQDSIETCCSFHLFWMPEESCIAA